MNCNGFSTTVRTVAADALTQLLASMEDGRIKFYLTWKCLQLRKQLRGLFRDGDYLPLLAEGAQHEHLCMFIRRYREDAVMVVAPRFFCTLTNQEWTGPVCAQAWADTTVELPEKLAGTAWRSELVQETLSLAPSTRRFSLALLLAHFPCALLTLVK